MWARYCKFDISTYRSRNHLGTLSLSDRSRCGAELILRVKEILHKDLEKEVFYRELVQRSWQEMCARELALYRDLARRPLIESLYRNLAQRFVTEILPRGLLQRHCQETSCRDLVQRFCQDTSYDLWRSSTETSHRDLLQGSCQEVSYIDLAKRAFIESVCRDLAILPQDLL